MIGVKYNNTGWIFIHFKVLFFHYHNEVWQHIFIFFVWNGQFEKNKLFTKRRKSENKFFCLIFL
jgi:hypothetical protein